MRLVDRPTLGDQCGDRTMHEIAGFERWRWLRLLGTHVGTRTGTIWESM